MAFQPYSFWDPEWRNYRGGQAQPIWLFNMTTHETVKTVQGDRERHTAPVWNNGMLYFLSEQDYIKKKESGATGCPTLLVLTKI